LKRNFKYLLPQLEKQYNAQIPNDCFYFVMRSENFIEKSSLIIKEIDEKETKMFQNLELLSKLFNENQSTMKTNPEDFFKTLNQFLNLYSVIIELLNSSLEISFQIFTKIEIKSFDWSNFHFLDVGQTRRNH
jgi:hypothetical protein